MKKYKFVKTWVNSSGKRSVVRADTEPELWLKYNSRRYGIEGINYEIPNNLLVKIMGIKSKEKPTVLEWSIKVCELKQPEVSEEYFKQFRYLLNKYIVNELGEYHVNEVKADDCQKVINSLKYRSQSLIKKVFNIFKYFFSLAVEYGLIETNPCQHLKKAKPKKQSRRRALTDEERTAFLTVINKFPKEFLLFKIMYYTGVRPSEVWRMKRSDIIVQAGCRLIKVKGTKSDSAVRVIPLPDEVWNDVSHLKSNEFLTTTLSGHQFNRDSYRNRVKRLKREMNIQMGAKLYRNSLVNEVLADDFTPYCLRHDYCSRLAWNCVDIRIAQRLLGHSSIRMTNDVYSHSNNLTVVSNARSILQGVTGCYHSAT